MLNQVASGRRAWRADTVEAREHWYLRLPPGCLAAADESLRRLRACSRPLSELRVDETPLGECRAESTFHTDNSFGAEVLDYVGLLCLQTARAGGRSQMVSGYAVHNELLARHRDVLEVLYRPFHIDRRGGVRPGEPPTVRYPVLNCFGDELLCRYLRFWIEAGHEKAGEPLTAAQREALDCLDAVLADPRLRVEFSLEPGDMYFLNNRWLLHNRTAYEDHREPERQRHLVRLWLKAAVRDRTPLIS